jgi:hypothetical protein
MKTIKTEKEYKVFTSYFNVMVVRVCDEFCVVRLLGKKK